MKKYSSEGKKTGRWMYGLTWDVFFFVKMQRFVWRSRRQHLFQDPRQSWQVVRSRHPPWNAILFVEQYRPSSEKEILLHADILIFLCEPAKFLNDIVLLFPAEHKSISYFLLYNVLQRFISYPWSNKRAFGMRTRPCALQVGSC